MRGEITVFLSLLLIILMSLIFTVVESARATAERAYMEGIGNIGMYSLFGEYSRSFLDSYDLFGLYAGDSTGNLNMNALKSKLEEYMEYNTEPEKGIISLQNFKMFTPELSESQIEKYMLITDFNGEPFRQQVVEYMKGALGVKGIESVLNKVKDVDTVDDAQNQYEWKEKSNEKELIKLEEEKNNTTDEIVEEKEESDKDVETELEAVEEEIENPLDTIKEMKNMGILSLVLKEPQNISSKEIVLSNQISSRTLHKGTFSEMDSDTSGIINSLLFNEYVLDKFSNAVEVTGNGLLDYQTEYVISGKKSDVENLKKVVHKLLLIREGCNFLYLLQDSKKVAEAEALATLLVGIFLLPPLIEVTKIAILLGWAYAESILDVRNLLSGGKVSLFKNAENWQLSLSDIPKLLSNLDDTKSDEENGLTYNDYLRLLLGASSSEKVTGRAMDVVEISMRTKTSNDKFKLDTCVTAMEYSSTWEDEFRFATLFSGLNLGYSGKIIIKNAQQFSY